VLQKATGLLGPALCRCEADTASAWLTCTATTTRTKWFALLKLEHVYPVDMCLEGVDALSCLWYNHGCECEVSIAKARQSEL